MFNTRELLVLVFVLPKYMHDFDRAATGIGLPSGAFIHVKLSPVYRTVT